MAHVLSLASGARRQSGGRHLATAAVFVQRSAVRRPTVIEQIARRHRAIIEVGGVRNAAALLGIRGQHVESIS
jgi:hypothetical protein